MVKGGDSQGYLMPLIDSNFNHPFTIFVFPGLVGGIQVVNLGDLWTTIIRV